MKRTTYLEEQLSKTLALRRQESKLRTLKLSPLNSVDFSSNDFLSLSTSPQFRQDYISELQNRVLPVGSTASRLLDGNSEYAEALEKRIAAFHGAECGLLVNSGFDANVSIFTCLPQPGDVIIYDELIHASVHDGMRMSRATTFMSFRHNSLDDLATKFRQCAHTYEHSNVFVAVEGVYSMDGDAAPLREITDLIEASFPAQNCHLIVDEAHSTGVYGEKGQGLVSALGLEKKVLVRLHTFGKAMASNGAIILSSDVIRSYLLNYARPIIYTTFMSYPTLAGIKVAYDWLETGATVERAAQLFDLIQYLHSQLLQLVNRMQPLRTGIMRVPDVCPQSAIFSIMMEEPREMATFCQQAGYVVRPVVHPTVPLGTERVRVCLHAGNTRSQVDGLISTMALWLTKKRSSECNLSSTPTYELSETRDKLPVTSASTGFLLQSKL